MKKSSLFGVAVMSAVLAGAGANASAALTTLYSTGFNAPTYTDGVLNSAADTTTPGQDGWLSTSGTTNLIAVSNSATNGVVTLGTSGQDVRHGVTATTSGSVYLTADITVTAAQTGDYFLHLTDGGTSNFYGRTYAKASGNGFALAVATSSGGTQVYGAELAFNTTYKILVRYDIVAGTTNDTAALFVNPTTADGSGDTAYVAGLNTGIDATTIAGVGLRQGNAAQSASVIVDNVAVAVQAAVPEPTTLAALAGFGVMALRRRRA